jgi:hypothetical protein
MAAPSPVIASVHLHDVIFDQDRLCLSLARSEALEGEPVVRAHKDRVAVEHCAIDPQRSDSIHGCEFGRSNRFKPPPVARPEDAGKSDRTTQLL